ncbi:MAG: hypothetical protein IPO27_02700 [Bacteroidetes bacterium]|nr:hypothetical protein [Bacteroidota bacterium]
MNAATIDEKVCYEATKSEIDKANKHKAVLHMMHVTAQQETHLLQNNAI